MFRTCLDLEAFVGSIHQRSLTFQTSGTQVPDARTQLSLSFRHVSPHYFPRFAQVHSTFGDMQMVEALYPVSTPLLGPPSWRTPFGRTETTSRVDRALTAHRKIQRGGPTLNFNADLSQLRSAMKTTNATAGKHDSIDSGATLLRDQLLPAPLKNTLPTTIESNHLGSTRRAWTTHHPGSRAAAAITAGSPGADGSFFKFDTTYGFLAEPFHGGTALNRMIDSSNGSMIIQTTVRMTTAAVGGHIAATTGIFPGCGRECDVNQMRGAQPITQSPIDEPGLNPLRRSDALASAFVPSRDFCFMPPKQQKHERTCSTAELNTFGRLVFASRPIQMVQEDFICTTSDEQVRTKRTMNYARREVVCSNEVRTSRPGGDLVRMSLIAKAFDIQLCGHAFAESSARYARSMSSAILTAQLRPGLVQKTFIRSTLTK